MAHATYTVELKCENLRTRYFLRDSAFKNVLREIYTRSHTMCICATWLD